MYSKYSTIHVMSSKRNTPNVKRGSLSMAHADKSWLFWIVLDVSAIRGTFPEEFASSGLQLPQHFGCTEPSSSAPKISTELDGLRPFQSVLTS